MRRYNDGALKDLFNSALDEPLSWWRMRGLDHLTFGQFVESLARSPAEVAGVPQVVGDEPTVAAVEAAAHSGMPRLVRKLEDPPMRSVQAAGMSPVNSSPVVPEAMVAVTESAPEPAPSCEPTKSAPESAPAREPAESAPARRVRSSPQSPLQPAESAPARRVRSSPQSPLQPAESAPFREPTVKLPALPVPPWPPALPAPPWPPALPLFLGPLLLHGPGPPSLPPCPPPLRHPPGLLFCAPDCGASGIRSLEGGFCHSYGLVCLRWQPEVTVSVSTWLVVFVLCHVLSPVYCLSPPILLPNHCFSGSTCVSLVTLICLPISPPGVCSPVLIRCLSCVFLQCV